MSLWPSTIKILISNLARTRKFSQLFKNTGVEDLLLSWTRVGHALRPIFMLWLVKIWQVSSFGKFMQHLETCLLLTAEADRVLSQLVMFFTVFSHWMHKMKYSCYQQSSVIHGWFVYWIFGWEMRRLSKSQIRFRMTSFSFFTLLDAGWKVPQAAFRSCISNGKSGVIIVFVFCISNFMKSSAVYEASLCTFVLRSETMISPSMRFDISLQSFKNL